MPDAEAAAPLEFPPLVIRYQGRDAATHELELSQLGESIQGFAKVFAVAGNFAYTGGAAQHFDALEVRVLAVPVPAHSCFEVWATIEPIVMTKEFWAGGVVAIAAIVAPVLTYVFSSRKGEEMRHLSEALERAQIGSQEVTNRLVGTVERLADALVPSVRKALAPIDRSCSSIDIAVGGAVVQSADSDTKQAFAAKGSRIGDHSRQFTGVITEFNMANGSCQVQLADEKIERLVPSRVLDPSYGEAHNPYAVAMAAKAAITFVAKYEEDADGRIVRLHIFDTVEDEVDSRPAPLDD